MLFPTGGYGWRSPINRKFAHSPQQEKFPISILSHPPQVLPPPPINNNFHVSPIKPSFLAVVIVPVLFSLRTLYSLCTHRSCKLFSLKKGSNSQNHSSSDFHHPMKKSHPAQTGFSVPLKCAPKNAFMPPVSRIDPKLASFPELAPILMIKPTKPTLLVGISSP